MALSVAVVVISFAAVQRAPPAVAGRVVLFYAACLVLGPALLYPLLRRRGAAVGAAVAGSLVVPLLWLSKECIAIANVFGLREAVYYAFNPLALGLFTAAALQMAIAEIVLRRRRTGRWQLLNGAGAVVLVILVLGGAYAILAARYDPSLIFWVYISIYRDFIAASPH